MRDVRIERGFLEKIRSGACAEYSPCPDCASHKRVWSKDLLCGCPGGCGRCVHSPGAVVLGGVSRSLRHGGIRFFRPVHQQEIQGFIRVYHSKKWEEEQASEILCAVSCSGRGLSAGFFPDSVGITGRVTITAKYQNLEKMVAFLAGLC